MTAPRDLTQHTCSQILMCVKDVCESNKCLMKGAFHCSCKCLVQMLNSVCGTVLIGICICNQFINQASLTNVCSSTGSLTLPEAYNIFAELAPFLKLIWCDMFFDWQMQRSGLQILPKCENVNPLHSTKI